MLLKNLLRNQAPAVSAKVSKVRLVSVLYFLVTGGSCRHINHRNLFTQRMCCKRQSHFVYIGQGKEQKSVLVDINLHPSNSSLVVRYFF